MILFYLFIFFTKNKDWPTINFPNKKNHRATSVFCVLHSLIECYSIWAKRPNLTEIQTWSPYLSVELITSYNHVTYDWKQSLMAHPGSRSGEMFVNQQCQLVWKELSTNTRVWSNPGVAEEFLANIWFMLMWYFKMEAFQWCKGSLLQFESYFMEVDYTETGMPTKMFFFCKRKEIFSRTSLIWGGGGCPADVRLGREGGERGRREITGIRHTGTKCKYSN